MDQRLVLTITPSVNRIRVPVSAAGLALLLFGMQSIAAERGIDPLLTGRALDKRMLVQGINNDPLNETCAQPTGALSFAAAVDIALCRNPTTRRAWAVARQRAAALGAAESAWLPSIAGSGERARVNGQHADGAGDIIDYDQYTTDAALQLSWTLYDFGGRGGRIRQARNLLDAAAAQVNSTTQQTIFSVVQVYYGAQAAAAILEAARSSESAARDSLEMARSLHRGGAATLGDELQAQTAYNRAVLSRLQLEAAAQRAQGELAVTLGFNANQALQLETPPPLQTTPALSLRVEELMTEATRQRPDLAAAQSQRDAAAAGVTTARATGRPSIAITAGRHHAVETGLPDQDYNRIGINVTVPFFSGFRSHYTVRQAHAALQESEESLQQVRLDVSLDVWNAYHGLDVANRQITQSAELLTTAEQNQEVARGRYQSGVASMLDVLTAQEAAAGARQTRVQAELDWRTAAAQLALALGRLSAGQPLPHGLSLSAVAP